MGHNPTIAIRDFTGEANFDPAAPGKASLRIQIRADSLEVTDEIGSKDRREIESTMNAEGARNCEVSRRSCLKAPKLPRTRLGEGRYKLAINGNLSLHGVTRMLPVTAQATLNGDMLRAYGEFSILQSNYGIAAGERGGRGAEIERRAEVHIRHRCDGNKNNHMCLAIPGKIVELLDEDRSLAVVDVLGVRRKVDLGLLLEDPPSTGDWVLIHVGFAMSKIGEEDALQQMRMLTELGESEAAMEEVQGYGWAIRRRSSSSGGPELSRRRLEDELCDLSTSFANPS